jgi:hypothetical protein
MKALNNWLLLLSLWAVSAQASSLQDEARAFDAKTKSSHSALFMNISGWMNKGLLVKKRVNLNQAFDRSPNPDEFKSIEDTFAVNYEFFMKDPEYKCRRPTYYNYFSNLLKRVPFENADCQMNRTVTLVSESVTSSSPMTSRTIDPARIYQIHYLFAGKGKQMMSRWGHAMFRLVMCAPGKPVGPDCMNDFSQHVVVSYRANVEDMTMDYTKGIDGSYASQLFLMNMSDVVDEYTKGEFRDVISLPMKMSRQEMTNFTDKLLENYWSYKGRYYFLTNNCATEAMNLLRASFPQNAQMQTANVVTPLGLYDYLVKTNIANTGVLDDQTSAIRKGFLFPGVTEKLQKSLDMFIDSQKTTFQDFALKATPTERRDAYQKTLDATAENKQVMVLANALRLEEQILAAREQAFAKKIGEAVFGKKPMPELKGSIIEKKIYEMKDLYKKLSAASYLAPGYGVPLDGEFKVATPEAIQDVLGSIQGDMQALKDAAQKYFPAEVEDMKQTMENRYWIMEKLK